MKTKLLNLLTYFKRKPKTVTKDLGAITSKNIQLMTLIEMAKKDEKIAKQEKRILGFESDKKRRYNLKHSL